jgi:adenylate cyclase
MPGRAVDAVRDARLEQAFVTEEKRALKLLMMARAAVTAAIIVFLLTQFPTGAGLYWAGLTLIFGLLGVVTYQVSRSRFYQPWQLYLFVALDLAIVTFIILYPNPFFGESIPTQQQLKYPNFDYLYVVVALSALTYAPGLAAWAGVAAVLAWGVAATLVLIQPGTISAFTLPGISSMTIAERAELWGNNHFVDISALIQQFFIMLILAAVLATAAWRARRLVRRQMRAERARANLSRYFSPGLIEELAGTDQPFGAVREQPVAVLFADIVGFTKLSEKAPPEAVIGMLRDFHGRMARAVFDHRGTVDKYIGDAIMATFGTPHAGPQDATNALACARAMLASVEEWNAERARRGEPAIAIGVGVHFGPAVMGDIGDERRLEYAVVGDTVNVASRLEAMTRERAVPLIASGALIEEIKRETNGGGASVAGLREAGTSAVPGRAEAIPIWTLDAAAQAAPA